MFKHTVAISTFGLILGLGLGSPAQATPRTSAPGKVTLIAAFNPASGWNDQVELAGVTSLGNCVTDSSTGLVVFAFVKNTPAGNSGYDRIYTLLLTSYTLGKTVTIATDDQNGLLNGFCAITWVNLNPT
jgi:hypothetical protein